MAKEIEIGENLTWILIILLFVVGGGLFEYLSDKSENETKAKTEMVITKTITDGVEVCDTTYIVKQ